jgi:hypothetical protein
MPSLIDNKYDKLKSINTDGIIIYTGDTYMSHIKTNRNIEKYNTYEDKILTDLKPSTLAVKGILTNLDFNEEKLIKDLRDPKGTDIVKLYCNYGEVINSEPPCEIALPKERTSKRGRKPKNKVKSKRKVQGSGKYFSSQITFEIFNADTKKIYKIKLFRNGAFQSPGLNNPHMTDIIKPIVVLRDYLRSHLNRVNIEIQHIISIMRNYVCRLLNPNYLIRIIELENILNTYENTNESNKIFEFIDNYNIGNKQLIKNYIGTSYNNIGIAEIQNNCERYFGLIIKFYRPVNWQIDKRTTIKILRSGKINIDGGNSIGECVELYKWLEELFIKYKKNIIYDKMNKNIILTDPDSDANTSIYDTE